MVKRRTTSFVVLAALSALSLSSCVDELREGTLTGAPQASAQPCGAPLGKSVEATWSNFKAASIALEYRDGESTLTSSVTNIATPSTTGTQIVATPAGALGGSWTVSAVVLYPRSNGRGTKETVALECAAPPIATLPPVTDAATTG
jgi:hypothetical protein